jgi:hypothetical protein
VHLLGRLGRVPVPCAGETNPQSLGAGRLNTNQPTWVFRLAVSWQRRNGARVVASSVGGDQDAQADQDGADYYVDDVADACSEEPGIATMMRALWDH